MKESDLYPPLKRYLEGQGYQVKGEVGDCDVLAMRDGEEPLVVELKTSLNLSVVLQAVDRLQLSETVYVGVPTGSALLRKQRKRVLKMLRMLSLGLLEIDVARDQVYVLQDPTVYRPRISKRKRGRLLGEFQKRVGDPNLGGATKRKGIMTAYRQRAIAIAHYLAEEGPTKASVIAKALDDPKARNLVYRDVYGWFDRVSPGIYAITPKGETEVRLWLPKPVNSKKSKK